MFLYIVGKSFIFNNKYLKFFLNNWWVKNIMVMYIILNFIWNNKY